MTHYIIRRLVQSFFLLIGISIIVFGIQRAAPGGPVAFSEDPRLPKEFAAQERERLGLDDPLPVQYWKWLSGVAQGNFGRSFVDRRPVLEKIGERLPATLLLNASALLVGLLGIPLGVIAAIKRDSWFDHGLRAFTVLLSAIPTWWLALVLLILMVKSGYRLFPLGGMYSPNDGSLLDRLHHLILPATMAGVTSWIGFSRFMRSELLEVIGQDYIRTARAKGLAERAVLFKHAIRNAMIVMVTILAGSFAGLLSGSLLFENVFSWPGMGRMAIEAANQRDYPVLMALVTIGAAIVILVQLFVDVLYGYIDPRIKLS